MDIGARRVFRVSLTVALSLAAGYGLALEIPFLAPIFAFMLTAAPKPPMGFKGTLGLAIALLATLGLGLLLTPLLDHYPATGLLVVLVCLFFCNYLTLHLGKALIGTLLTVGVALISAAGLLAQGLAMALISGMVIGMILAVVCQWLVYPLFPEDDLPAARPAHVPSGKSRWLALRATLIVFPGFMLAMINPALYLPIVMKTVALGQQACGVNAGSAGRELLGSTFVAGMLAVLFWTGLSVKPDLWMFFLWMLLTGVYITGKFFGVIATRLPPTFWQNVLVTLLILLGPAVADSANGKDVYKAFAVRMGLFVAVTIYAWGAVVLLDRLYERRPVAAGKL